MKCKYCGQEIPEISIFCMFCGERLARKRREKGKDPRIPKPRQLATGEWSGRVMINGQRETVYGETEAEYYDRARALKAGVIEARKIHPEVPLREAIDRHIATHDLSPETVRGYRIIQGRYKKLMDRDVWSLTAEDVRDALKAERKIYPVPKARQRRGGTWGAVVSCGEESRRIICATPEEYAEKAQAFKREILGEGLSPKTQLNDKGLICTAIHSVTGARLEVSTSKVVHTGHLFLEPEQITRFCGRIRGTDVEIPALLALSSLRRSELIHLDWKDVDLGKRLIMVAGADVYDEHHHRVSKDENKNESSRRPVPIMMDQLLDALWAVKDKTGRVVRCAPDTVRRRVNKICREAGLPEIGTHGLRHSYASLSAHLQMPRAISREIGGWKNDKIMDEIYTHVVTTDKDRFKNEMSHWYNVQNYREITAADEKTQENQGV